jgi:hypothetical protein
MTISVHKKVDANSPNIFFLFFYLTISVHFLWTLILLSYFIFKYFYIGVLASTIVDANSLVIFYIYMTISVHKKVDANSPNIFLIFLFDY